MKENKAPEKIYVDANEDWHRTYTAFTAKAKGNDIEYIRTDAFIEKAAAWLRLNLSNYFDDTRETFELFVDDFRKYLKEE